MEINICITFDLDFSDYVDNWKRNDDFRLAIEHIFPYLEKNPEYKFTWYIRLDNQIRKIYGSIDYIFSKYNKEIEILKENGHEIAWHPHIYRESSGKWIQNTCINEIIDELSSLVPMAKLYKLKSVRMGWGFHCNETMQLLSDADFESDSSAIPRPQYRWEETYKDWTVTPCIPYYPCKSDYRKPGEPSLPILEIPMSVTHVKAPYDTEDIMRYLNPAYHTSLFEAPLKLWLSQYSHLVTVTHPYELAGERQHGLLSFNMNVFIKNMLKMKEVADHKNCMLNFLTISEFTSRWKGGDNGKQEDRNP